MATLSARDLYSLALIGWLDPAERRIAVAVALAESGGRTDARNPSGATGLWQIMPATARWVGQDPARLTDPTYNVVTARKVFDKQGWQAWTTYTSGAYKKFLDDVPEGGPSLPNIPGTEGITDGLSQVGAAAKDAVRAGQWIADPANLVRVVEVVGGVVLVVVGLVLLARPAIDAGANVAANVVTKGMAKKVRKAAGK